MDEVPSRPLTTQQEVDTVGPNGPGGSIDSYPAQRLDGSTSSGAPQQNENIQYDALLYYSRLLQQSMDCMASSLSKRNRPDGGFDETDSNARGATRLFEAASTSILPSRDVSGGGRVTTTTTSNSRSSSG